VRTLLAGLFRLWRATLGAVLPDSCRFTPTCSRYAEEAFLRHGPLVATAKTIWRLLRCQPFSKGGYDPVIRSRPPCRPPDRKPDR
jgi:putative membrane protein insertion efficiency factor